MSNFLSHLNLKNSAVLIFDTKHNSVDKILSVYAKVLMCCLISISQLKMWLHDFSFRGGALMNQYIKITV